MKTRATVICADNGQILFVRKEKSKWTLPGGKVEPGETPAAAAARELREETGLDIDELLYLLKFEANRILHYVFEASVLNADGARPLNEISDCEWHSYGAIQNLDLSDATKSIVKAFIRRL
ncbi:NUDIX hydrolase [Pseudomonas sp. NPDC087697]|uniref:NUDIX hydrolase n=1 Tax=Pseudomonas sp. NPDC087697 TaxID=3364447 RepID=UPI0037F50A9E